ncbi:beta-lactamase family protein [Thalassovita mediterranea]|nr:beta-lactamase family protein [Thalassovita mediterranea]
MKRLVLGGACAAALVLPSGAQSAEEQLESRYRALAAIIDARLEKEAVPGAAIGLIHDQQLVWSYNYGVEDLETGTPVSGDTVFSICSVSKLFNGVAAMSLVEDGSLDLDETIFTYLDTEGPSDETGAEETATLRNILSHVSGLPREGVEDFWADTSFPDAETLMASTSAHDQLYRPYDHWQYSNLGMALIGEAIAGASGKTWGEYVNDTILAPLGMGETRTDMPFEEVGNGFARGYYVRNANGERAPVQEHSFRAYAPAAGIASSVNDMAKFASWHFRLHETGGEEILKATTLGNMQRVHWVGPDFEDPAWGLAYGARRWGEKTLWGHGGYCPGARTDFAMRLPDRTGYVMMMTANDVSPGTYTRLAYDFLNDKVTGLYGKDDDSGEDEDQAEADTPDIDLSQYEGYYATPNYDWDRYIGIDDGKLFSISVFDADPVKNMEIYVHEEGDRFYRERDDETEGEPVIFERDGDGNIVSLVQHSYRSYRRED